MVRTGISGSGKVSSTAMMASSSSAGSTTSAMPIIVHPIARKSDSIALDHAAANLVELDALKQGLEIAFAKSLIALALDDFEENRADHVGGENLQ